MLGAGGAGLRLPGGADGRAAADGTGGGVAPARCARGAGGRRGTAGAAAPGGVTAPRARGCTGGGGSGAGTAGRRRRPPTARTPGVDGATATARLALELAEPALEIDELIVVLPRAHHELRHRVLQLDELARDARELIRLSRRFGRRRDDGRRRGRRAAAPRPCRGRAPRAWHTPRRPARHPRARAHSPRVTATRSASRSRRAPAMLATSPAPPA